MPLDNAVKTRGATGSLGYVSTVYKVSMSLLPLPLFVLNLPVCVVQVVSKDDGIAYCVRRVDYVKTSPHVTSNAVKRWAAVFHPAIVTLRDCFVYNSGAVVSGCQPASIPYGICFAALFFVHDYYPSALTMREAYLESGSVSGLLPEATLWSIASQLATAIQLRVCCGSYRYMSRQCMRVRVCSGWFTRET